MATMNLTEPAICKAVREAIAGKARADISDAAMPGLRLRITAVGKASWVLACRDHAGAMRRFHVGVWDMMGVAQARTEASDLRAAVRKGADPIADRRAATAAAKARALQERLTLEVLIDDWARLHLVNRRPRYADEAVRALKHAFAAHLAAAADQLDRAAIRAVIDGIGRRRKANSMASDQAAISGRTVAYGRACYQWALRREMVPANPFTALPVPEAPPSRERVLTDAELVEILQAAGTTDAHGRIVWLLAATGAWREEVAGLRWEELSPDLATWTLPRARAKNGVEHIVPLSDLARTAIKGLERTDGLVLNEGRATPFSGWSKAKLKLDAAIAKARAKAAGEGADVPPFPVWRLHDLRRTTATGLQRLGVRLEVTEAVLGHVLGSRSGIVGVYQRHDWATEKRAALVAWSGHVEAALTGRAQGNVIQLQRA